MDVLESTTLTSELVDAVRGKLQNALAPLKLAELVKGLPKPRKMKAAEVQNEVRSLLDEQVRIGATFRHPSGKNGETRFWSHDEKHLLCERALELAALPLSLAALKKALAKEVKGTDAAFVESVIHELIGEGKLFEYSGKRGGPLFGASPPPSPLELPKHAKTLTKLVKECRKLLDAAKVSVEDLLHAVQTHLHSTPTPEPGTARSQPTTPTAEATQPLSVAEPTEPPRAELDEVILKALEHAPVLSLAELRASMPAEYRGSTFDAAVLRLADERQVALSQDAVPAHFSDAEKAEFVRDGGALFTTIAKWS